MTTIMVKRHCPQTSERLLSAGAVRNTMKTIFSISVLAVLLLVAASPCFALRSLVPLSKERAKQLGMEIRSQANGPQVWVELEFKPEGELKHFSHVELEITEGGKFLLGYAPLGEKRSSSGSVVVRFLADRAYLDKLALIVVLGDFGDVGYELRVKDFVDLGKSPQSNLAPGNLPSQKPLLKNGIREAGSKP
jgi:hypothetical protein